MVGIAGSGFGHHGARSRAPLIEDVLLLRKGAGPLDNLTGDPCRLAAFKKRAG